MGDYKKKVLISMAVVLCCGCAGYALLPKLFSNGIVADNNKSNNSKKKKVQVFTVKATDIEKKSKFLGHIRANSQVVLKSEVDGIIKTVSFEEGSTVYKGDLLIVIDDSLAAAKYKEILARLEHAKAEYSIGKNLGKNKYMPEMDILKRKAEMEALEAQAEISRIELSKYKIYAPFDGKIGLRNISVGEYLTRNKEIVTLINSDPLCVDFKVPEMEISSIQKGQSFVLKINDNKNEYTGVIKAISPVSDRANHSFVVRGVIDENDGLLFPGQFASVVVDTEQTESAIMVPESALIRDDSNYYVFKVVEGVALKTIVTRGTYESNGDVEILTGISDKDVIIINGTNSVSDGSRVDVIGDNVDKDKKITDEMQKNIEDAGLSNKSEETSENGKDDSK